MRSLPVRLFLGVLLMGILPLAANAATTSFGPSAYLKTGDTPAGFFCPNCPDPLHIETFEDNALDAFLSIDNGSILKPNYFSGATNSVTDSVDGDDGSVDGNGNGGHSWFTGADNVGDKVVTVTFDSTVTSAGLVFTDGDPNSNKITLEAFDINGDSLGVLNAGDLADGMVTGETAEDSFLGFHDDNGAIKSIRLTMSTLGIGIEIDHIQWQNCLTCIPEPASMSMGVMGLLGMIGLRRRRR